MGAPPEPGVIAPEEQQSGAARPRTGEDEVRLARFLAGSFSPTELRGLIHQWEADGELTQALPETARPGELATSVVTVLCHRGLVGRTFFEALLAERPGRHQEIDALARAFGCGPLASPNPPGPRPRSKGGSVQVHLAWGLGLVVLGGALTLAHPALEQPVSQLWTLEDVVIPPGEGAISLLLEDPRDRAELALATLDPGDTNPCSLQHLPQAPSAARLMTSGSGVWWLEGDVLRSVDASTGVARRDRLEGLAPAASSPAGAERRLVVDPDARAVAWRSKNTLRLSHLDGPEAAQAWRLPDRCGSEGACTWGWDPRGNLFTVVFRTPAARPDGSSVVGLSFDGQCERRAAEACSSPIVTFDLNDAPAMRSDALVGLLPSAQTVADGPERHADWALIQESDHAYNRFSLWQIQSSAPSAPTVTRSVRWSSASPYCAELIAPAVGESLRIGARSPGPRPLLLRSVCGTSKVVDVLDTHGADWTPRPPRFSRVDRVWRAQDGARLVLESPEGRLSLATLQGQGWRFTDLALDSCRSSAAGPGRQDPPPRGRER